MRAIRYRSFGGPDGLRVEDVAEPLPGPGEALVRVRAAALNPIDAKILAGSVPAARPPLTLGCDFAGEVEGTGERVFGSLAGAGVVRDGAFAQAVAVPRECLAPLPPMLPFERGAALGIVFLTARTCVDAAAPRPATTAAVYGAGGGVGTAYLQLARRSGARLVAVTSGGASARRARALGAAEVLDRSREDVFARLAELAPRGLDVIVDTVGGSWFERSIALLAPGGRLLSVGVTGGERSRVELDIPSFYRRRAAIVGIATGMLSPAERRDGLLAIAEALRAGEIDAPETETMPLEGAPQAFARTLAGAHGGRRLVLVP